MCEVSEINKLVLDLTWSSLLDFVCLLVWFFNSVLWHSVDS